MEVDMSVQLHRKESKRCGNAKKATEGLQLEKGDALFATGSIGRLGGKPVLFADRVAELARIERPDQPSVSSGPPSGDAEPGDAAARQSASSQR
jgi:hypothetical protein